MILAAFHAPYIDYHALAPEIILSCVIVALLLIDAFTDEEHKYLVTQAAGIGLAVTAIPIITLAIRDQRVSMFGGAYVVDQFSIVFKGLFIVVAYIVLLMSTRYIEEGDYYQGEFSFLLLCSTLGMVTMASSRDLISIFLSLELLSIPAYLLAGWRKRDEKGNEAALKYYLLGVLASAVMLYGMSIIFGVTNATILSDVRQALAVLPAKNDGLVAIGIFFIIVGFAFKISAVPFQNWAPDTYEGAPTPITAFLSVASKTAGFVALLELVFIAFIGRSNVWGPLLWTLSVVTMTVGNVVALRQKNIVRMLAYSSIAQAGYMLVPFAVAGYSAVAIPSAFRAVITYLLIYAVMNLGAFTIVIAVARKTRSGEISSYGGLFSYAPGLTVAMTFFLFSLAGIPPFGGWFAKLMIFRSVAVAGTTPAIILGVIVAINSVIALVYYANVAKQMFMQPVPDNVEISTVPTPPPLTASLGLLSALTLISGILPNAIARLGQIATFVK
jgi:NADH-quinone oxidoreductase subunit N